MKFHENMIFLFEPLKKNPQARGQCYQMPKNTGNKKWQGSKLGWGSNWGVIYRYSKLLEYFHLELEFTRNSSNYKTQVYIHP